jgi:heme exporter protein A
MTGASDAADITARTAVAPVVVDRVGRTFGHRRALIDVTTTLRPGEVTVILGPNGAGKSTLLGILATLLAPTRGTVRWGEVQLRRGAPERAALGYVGHEPGLYLDLGAAQNLELFATLYGLSEPGRRAREALARVGLGEAAGDAPVRTFSRGMQQRLALGRALLHQPAILLFDEPGSALDPAGAAWLAEELGRERDAGRVVVLVTHDLDAAGALAEHVLVLRRGRVVRDERRDRAWGPAALRAAYDESVRERAEPRESPPS